MIFVQNICSVALVEAKLASKGSSAKVDPPNFFQVSLTDTWGVDFSGAPCRC